MTLLLRPTLFVFQLYEYDQREFLVGANLDDMGYVYVPQECDTRNYGKYCVTRAIIFKKSHYIIISKSSKKHHGSSGIISIDFICIVISLAECKLHVHFHGCSVGR